MRRIPFVLLTLLIAALALAACSGDAPSESDEAASAALAEQAESAQAGITVDDADSAAVANTAPEPGSDIGSDGAGGANNSDEGESRGRTSASAASATTQFVVASARTTVEQSSYRFRWSITLDGVAELPGEVTLGGSGAVDGEAGLVEMELDFGALFEALGSSQEGVGDLSAALALFGDEPISFVIDGTTLYLRWPLFAGLFGASTAWVAFEEIEATDSTELPGLEGFVAPGRYLEAFDALFDLREIGPESLDGVETTRYDGIIDLTAAKAAAGEGLDPISTSTANAFLDIPGGLSELPISVWVDADGRVRRFSMGFSDEIDDVPVRFELVYELFAFGETIHVAVPDPSEVTIVDGSSLFGAFGEIEFTS